MYTDRFIFLASITFPVFLVAIGLYREAFWTFAILFPIAVAGYVHRQSFRKKRGTLEDKWKQFLEKEMNQAERVIFSLEDSSHPDEFGKLVASYDGKEIYDVIGFEGVRFGFVCVVPPQKIASVIEEVDSSRGRVRIFSGCLKYELLG